MVSMSALFNARGHSSSLRIFYCLHYVTQSHSVISDIATITIQTERRAVIGGPQSYKYPPVDTICKINYVPPKLQTRLQIGRCNRFYLHSKLHDGPWTRSVVTAFDMDGDRYSEEGRNLGMHSLNRHDTFANTPQ